MQSDELSIFSFDRKLALSKDKNSFYLLDNAFVTSFNISTKSDFDDFQSFGDDYKTRVLRNTWGEVELSLRCGNIEIRSGKIQDVNPFNSKREVQKVFRRIEDFSTLQRCIDF